MLGVEVPVLQQTFHGVRTEWIKQQEKVIA